jgi:predicted dehydrogenase
MSGGPIPAHVAVIGCGRWGRHIVRDLLGLGCQVTVLARSEESRSRARETGATRVITSIDELPEVQGLVVATPTASHYEVISRVLDIGVPIFTEKPMTADPIEAEKLLSQATNRLFVMDKWRYHPGVERLRDLVAAGELGDILGIHTKRLGWGNPHADVDAGWILLPHDLSIILEITGSLPEVVSALGVISDGEVKSASLHLSGPIPIVVEISSLAPLHQRSVTVVGTRGIAALDDGWADHVVRYPVGAPGEPEIRRDQVSAELPLLRELSAFVDHLSGGPPPRSSAEEGALIVSRVAKARDLVLSS